MKVLFCSAQNVNPNMFEQQLFPAKYWILTGFWDDTNCRYMIAINIKFFLMIMHVNYKYPHQNHEKKEDEKKDYYRFLFLM